MSFNKTNLQYDSVVPQYVASIERFSSQYGRNRSSSYGAENLIGATTIYPRYGDYMGAFVLRTYGPWWKQCPSYNTQFQHEDFVSEDYVDLSFNLSVYPKALQIFETYNPGAVVRILAYNAKDDKNLKWMTLWSGQPRSSSKVSRIFAPQLCHCPFTTNLIRLEFNSTHLHYYMELDAVCLYGTLEDIEEDPGNPGTEGIQKIAACAEDEMKDAELSSRMSQLHINETDESYSDSGLFDKMPDEVVLMIIEHLDVISLCHLASTCRFLHRHCYDPMLYTQLDLQPYWDKITSRSLDGLTSRCSHLQHLNLAWCGVENSISPKAFVSFLDVCSGLITLHIACCDFIDIACMKAIAEKCKKLQDLDLQSITTLDDEGISSIQGLTELTRLNLYLTKVKEETACAIISNNPHLMHVNFGACGEIFQTYLIAEALAKHCKNLRSVNFWFAKHFTEESLSLLCEKCPLLEEIDIGWVMGDDMKPWRTPLLDLKVLYLTSVKGITDTDVELIVQNLPQLEQLDLLGSDEVTSAAIERLLQCCLNLRYLDLSFCGDFKEAAIPEWNERYPHVNIKSSHAD